MSEPQADQSQAFCQLDPDHILDAVEALGYRCDGRLLALNSYENRVYQIGIEDTEPIVAKFYRPDRWTDAAIEEEHAFTLELEAEEIPVIAPLTDASGHTLFHQGPFRLALYPRRGGHAPELDRPDQLEQMGRFLARIHNLGAIRDFIHRPTLDIASFGEQPRQYLMDSGLIPPELQDSYASLTADLLQAIRAAFERAGAVRQLRLHGDCHPGNILWTDAGPHIVDLDDARMGPAIQDLWMLLSGDRMEMTARLADVLDGYTQFRVFDPRELHLLEALRTLRMIHYAAWLARRWDDPAFPQAFPWFNGSRYWDEHILSLREQAALLQEPPLVWD